MEKSVINVKEQDKNEIVIEENNGKRTLTAEIVKKYICKEATEEEIYIFMRICEAQKLNPFLREIYLVKYGSKAQYVVGKETFLKRANRNPKFIGFEAGTEGEIPKMTGWAKVYVKGYKLPVQITVHYSEYRGQGPIWREKPKTMLRKVALVQALREAFPDDLGGLYDQSEINSIHDELSHDPINVESKDKTEEIVKFLGLVPSKEEPLKFKQGKYTGELVSDMTDVEYLKQIINHDGDYQGKEEYQKACENRLAVLENKGGEAVSGKIIIGR